MKPTLEVSPLTLAFGQVKNGGLLQRNLTLTAVGTSTVTITSIVGSGPSAASFTLSKIPTEVVPGTPATVGVTFAPLSFEAYTAQLTIKSNDADHPEVVVPLSGEGAKGILGVAVDCTSARHCGGTVQTAPLGVQFAPEIYMRASVPDPTTLPALVITNEGPVELVVSKLSISGPDAAAFAFVPAAPLGMSGKVLQAAEGFNVPIRFSPTSEQQTTYSATATVESDDPDAPMVTVALLGTLKPNAAPSVCANIITVKPDDDAIRDFNTPTAWAPLLSPTDAGYDFTATRDIEPRAEVTVSALSSLTDTGACTSDPEDGRTGLVYTWSFDVLPAGVTSLPISSNPTSQARFKPEVAGYYQLRLNVADAQGHERATTLRFAVAVKRDLVVQLHWDTSNVDLDLHLVRPAAVADAGDPFGGAFSFFESGPAGKSAGDINGYAVLKTTAAAGLDFDWGDAGSADDPRLKGDDLGRGALTETVALNSPENDPRCATTPCAYRLYVHGFVDGRAPSSIQCLVDGGTSCHDGDACGCAAPAVCVASAAPAGVAATGAGSCTVPPKAELRVYLKGSPIAAKVIPVEGLTPADSLLVRAPCAMQYVADVVWPAKTAIGSLPDGGTPLATIELKGIDAGSERIVAPVTTRYGTRKAGSLSCEADATFTAFGTSINWYSRQP